MTRGPANPMSAPGSAIFRSPSIARLAVTPPVVGSVSTLMYGMRSSSRRMSAAEILAICIRLMAPSCMRAPPEAETIISGAFWAMERSMARVIFSPITHPMLPPMNFGSMAQICTLRPSSVPAAEIKASANEVACWVVARRS